MQKQALRLDDALDFLTPLEAAQLVRLSKRTLDNMRHFGNGPKYRKLGGKIVYLRADLVDWANDNEHVSTQHK
jgi:predicted DNA-binding transcriptional regulator AlpA